MGRIGRERFFNLAQPSASNQSPGESTIQTYLDSITPGFSMLGRGGRDGGSGLLLLLHQRGVLADGRGRPEAAAPDPVWPLTWPLAAAAAAASRAWSAGWMRGTI